MQFLERVVNECMNHFDHPSDVIFILPGKRAGVFLKKHLHQKSSKTMWSPKTISFHEFAAEYSKVEVIDNISLHFELYKAYTEITDQPESFDKFEVWATQILNDFNAVDNYLCNAEAIYKDLKNIKQIEDWSFNMDPLSKDQLQFLHFWKLLGKLYFQLRKNLSEQSKAYAGMLMRDFAEKINEVDVNNRNLSICFAGFNALSKAETKIIKHFQDKHNTLIFWDSDSFYEQNSANPAGHFIRKSKKIFDVPEKRATSRINQANKTFKTVDAPGTIAQVRYVGQVLANHSQDENLAIVLADENLLIPTLESLTTNIEKVNVTMGMSFILTPLYKVLDRLVALYAYAENKSKHSNNYTFLFADFKRLILELITVKYIDLSEALIRKLDYLEQVEKLTHLTEETFRNKGIFDLSSVLSDLFQFKTCTIDDLISFCLKISSQISVNDKVDLINKEVAIQFENILHEIAEHLKQFSFIDSILSFRRIFSQLAAAEKLSFFGEPLAGIQIMGMLETRAIDFDKIIILGANEGTLPAAIKPNSFFPNELKKYYGIPNNADHDAVYAYYFYRLLQAPSEAHIVFSSSSDDFGASGEKTRFIHQLQLEVWKENLRLDFKEINLNANVDIGQETSIIAQNALSIEKIKTILQNSGLSPSAMHRYLTCPLDYYFTYVLGFREEVNLIEIDSAMMGSCIHNALEELYLPYVGKEALKSSDLKNISEKAQQTIQHQFAAEKLWESVQSGANHLLYLTAVEMTQRVLNFDKKRIKNGDKIEILHLEKDLKEPLKIQHKNHELTVNLRGKIDRIEKVNNVIQIIDYKSGKVDPGKFKLSNPDAIRQSSKIKSLQLCHYLWLWSKSNLYDPKQQVVCSILPLASAKTRFHSLSLKNKEIMDDNLISEIIENFENYVSETILSMIEPERDYTHNKSSNFCNYCI